MESAKAAYDKLGAQVQNYVPQAVKDKLNTTFPEEPVLANGYYTIGNGSVVIDILDVRYEDNIPAVSYQFLEQNNQLFYFEKLTDGKYKITAVHSKKALTMQTNGSVVQSHFAGADNQKWEIAKVGSQYTLKNVGQNRYLSVTGSSVSGVANATNLALTQKAGIQRIVHVVAVEDGTYQMQSRLAAVCRRRIHKHCRRCPSDAAICYKYKQPEMDREKPQRRQGVHHIGTFAKDAGLGSADEPVLPMGGRLQSEPAVVHGIGRK